MSRLTWNTLEGPQREVALLVLRRGPLSRAALAEHLHLSPGSITRLSAPLVRDHLVNEGTPVRDGSLGPPRKPLTAEIGNYEFVGVKVTGTDLYGVRTNLRGDIEISQTAPLSASSPEYVSDAIAALVSAISTPALTGVGVSIGGIARNGIVERAPFLEWAQIPFQELLNARIPVPVTIENDVVALTDSERWFGLGQEVDSFAVLTLGAGVGCGLVIRDATVHAPDTGLGLIGHFPLSGAGGYCYMGHLGCATGALTIPGISGALANALQRPAQFDEAFDLADAGHLAAIAILRASAEALAQMIAAIVNISGVEHVVLAGEGIRLAAHQRDVVEAALARFRDPLARPVHLTNRDPSFASWARGAAVVAIQEFTADAAANSPAE